jgi:hypothetical protein
MISYTWADENNTVIASTDGRHIPADPRNPDYADLLRLGIAPSPYVAPAPTAVDVTAERDRRLRVFPFGGKMYDFCDGRGSDINVAGAGTLALAAIIAGAQPGDLRWAFPETDFVWIAADNSSTAMDAQTCLAFAQSAAGWKARHIRAARVLKDTSPIPADYANDARW